MRFALLAILPVAACMAGGNSPSLQPEEDACGAAELQHLTGEAAANHDFQSSDRPVRIIPPGSAVTMDFNPERLNVETDAGGVITRIYCG